VKVGLIAAGRTAQPCKLPLAQSPLGLRGGADFDDQLLSIQNKQVFVSIHVVNYWVWLTTCSSTA
jgi:hypothetical protein